jgi:hypothetical protein
VREGYHLAQSQRLLDEVVPDKSRLKPDDDGGQDDHRAIIERAFLIPGGYTAPLFKPVDAAFHHVAPRIDRLVKDEWTTRSRRASRALVASLWDRMVDLPLAQPAATPWIAVAFVSDEAVWAGTWSPASAGAWNPDALQDRFQLGAFMAVPWADHDGERSSAAVTGEMELGGQPSTTAPESLVGGVRDPFFSRAAKPA